MTNWKAWLHGLAAALISAFFTSVAGFIALPTVFTLDKNGLVNMVQMSVPPAILAVALYLKTSPLPPLTATVDSKGNITDVSGSVQVDVQSKK